MAKQVNILSCRSESHLQIPQTGRRELTEEWLCDLHTAGPHLHIRACMFSLRHTQIQGLAPGILNHNYNEFLSQILKECKTLTYSDTI